MSNPTSATSPVVLSDGVSCEIPDVGNFRVFQSGDKYGLVGKVHTDISFEGTPAQMAIMLYDLGILLPPIETQKGFFAMDELSGLMIRAGETFPEIGAELQKIEDEA